MSILREKTQAVIETVAAEFEGVMGVHAFDPSMPGEGFEVNADEVFPTASIIKIPILLEFYRQVEVGILDPDMIHPLKKEHKVGGSGILQHLSEKTRITLEDWVKLMINLSDNTATNYMMDVVGVDNVNRLLTDLGFKETKLLRKMQAKNIDPDVAENLSTPRELSLLLKKMLDHDGLSAGVCERSLEVLKLGKDGIISEGVGEDVVVADKSGWMGAVRCDAGIVYLSKPYIVTVMAKWIPVWDWNGLQAKETMQSAVSEIHQYYKNTSTTTRYGRRV